MNIREFKLVENKQRPDLCYSFEKYNEAKTKKYSLFTMDGGKTFLASVVSVNYQGKLVDTDFSETFNTREQGLDAIVNFLPKEECTVLELFSTTKLKSSGKKTKSSLMDYIARATPTISPKFYSKPIDRDIDAKLEEGNNN